MKFLGPSARREKMQHCSTIADVLVTPATASKTSAADFSKSLTVSMEQFFSLLDDGDLDVRTVAEESINRVINALRDSHSGRLQVRIRQNCRMNRQLHVPHFVGRVVQGDQEDGIGAVSLGGPRLVLAPGETHTAAKVPRLRRQPDAADREGGCLERRGRDALPR